MEIRTDEASWHPKQPGRQGLSLRDLLIIIAIITLIVFVGNQYVQSLERDRSLRYARDLRRSLIESEKEIRVCEEADQQGRPYDPAVRGIAHSNALRSWREEASWHRDRVSEALKGLATSARILEEYRRSIILPF